MRKERDEVIRRYWALNEKYRKHVSFELPCCYSECAVRLLFAIMIFEDFNRPWLLRICERMVFLICSAFGHQFQMTLGIMQVRTSENISDIQSIQRTVYSLQRIAQESIIAGLPCYVFLQKSISHHNGSSLYDHEVMKIYGNICQADPFPQLQNRF